MRRAAGRTADPRLPPGPVPGHVDEGLPLEAEQAAGEAAPEGAVLVLETEAHVAPASPPRGQLHSNANQEITGISDPSAIPWALLAPNSPLFAQAASGADAVSEGGRGW